MSATPSRPTARRDLWIVLGITLLAAATRFYDLTGESLWYDEAYSVWTSAMDIASVRVLWGWQIEFPLYYLLLHYWMGLFGQSDLAVRAYGAVAGVLAIWPMYALGRELFGRRGAIVGALLLATNPYHIWYSQEVRMYAWAVLFTLISLYAFLRVWRGARWPWWMVHILATGLTFHLHYYIGWIVLVQNLCWFGGLIQDHRQGTLDQKKPRIGLWIADQVGVGLLALPGLVVFLTKLVGFNQWGWLGTRYGSPGLLSLVDLLKTFVLSTTFSGPSWLGWVIVASFAFCAFWASIAELQAWRKGGTIRGLLFLLLSLLLPIGLVFLLGQRWAIWVPRYLLLCLPSFLLLVAWGLSSFRRPIAWGLALMLIAGSLYATSAMYDVPQKEDWRGVAAYLTVQMGADDVMILMDAECRVPWERYFQGSVERIEVSRFADESALDQVADTVTMRARKGRIWLIVSHADSAALEQRLGGEPTFTRLKTPIWVGIKLVAYGQS